MLQLLRAGDDHNNEWSIEKLESMLTDSIDQNIIEIIGDTYKIKHTQPIQQQDVTATSQVSNKMHQREIIKIF